jgi:hypothetical protein
MSWMVRRTLSRQDRWSRRLASDVGLRATLSSSETPCLRALASMSTTRQDTADAASRQRMLTLSDIQRHSGKNAPMYVPLCAPLAAPMLKTTQVVALAKPTRTNHQAASKEGTATITAALVLHEAGGQTSTAAIATGISVRADCPISRRRSPRQPCRRRAVGDGRCRSSPPRGASAGLPRPTPRRLDVSCPSGSGRSGSRPSARLRSGRRTPRRAWRAGAECVRRPCARRRSTRIPTRG